MPVYSDKVMDHFMNPRNVGEIADADGIGEVGNPVCGDMMTFYIKVDNNHLHDVKFKTFGCGAAIAVSSIVSEMAMGKTLEEAFAILKFTRKAAAEPVRRLVQSAYSNAVSQLGTFDLNTEEITVKKIVVEQGPTFKRWRPRAMGRATPIMKRTSHISVELEVPEPEGQ